MKPAAFEMKPAVIQHSFRIINFEYYSPEPLSDFENNLLKNYKALHEKAHKENQHLLKVGEFIKTKLQVIDNFKAEFEIHKAEVSRYEMLFGLATPTMPDGDYKTNPKELEDTLNDYGTRLSAYHATLKPMPAMYGKVIRQKDGMEAGFENFSKNFAYPLAENHETMVIDIVRFDQDYNDFREHYASVHELYYKHTDGYNEFVDQHNAFMDEIHLFYKRAEKLCNHIQVIQKGTSANAAPENAAHNFSSN